MHVLVCVMKYPQLMYLACCERQSITPYKTSGKITVMFT